MTGRDRELKPRAVWDTRRKLNVKRVTQPLFSDAFASHARLGPRFAAPAALRAQPSKRDIERNGRPRQRLLPGQTNRRTQLGRTLVSEKRLPHAIERGRHRREVDDHIVGKTVRIVTTVIGRPNRDLIAPVVVERVPSHRSLLVP
jgi:hypothetical protein